MYVGVCTGPAGVPGEGVEEVIQRGGPCEGGEWPL